MQELPETLRALFTAPAKWLEQLTPVKLTCLAGGYQKLWPNNKQGEEVLVQMMEAAIQVHSSLSLTVPKPRRPLRCRSMTSLHMLLWIV